MKTRKFNGRDVSCLCLGTMTFGAPVSEADAIRMVHWSLDHGINFFDTANIYEGYARKPGTTGGVAETILGKAVRGHRDACVIATKAGYKVGEGKEDGGLSRAHLKRELEKSLRRLGVEQVDLYYMHHPDSGTPLQETVETCAEFINEGRVGAWGVSNYDAAGLRQVLALCDAMRLPRPVAIQPPLSLLKAEACVELLPCCAREKIAAMPYQVLQAGLLTGKYRGGQAPKDSRAGEKPDWLRVPDEKLAAEIARHESEASRRVLTLMEYALAWALEQPSVASLVLGARSIAQLESLSAAISKS